MVSHAHRTLSHLLALSLGLFPRQSAAGAPVSCPGTADGASDEDALGACRHAARYAEGRERASFYSQAAVIGRKAYLASTLREARTWLEGAGHDLVHYGTLNCDSAVDLERDKADQTLGICIELLATHILDLERIDDRSRDSIDRTIGELQRRRERLQALREALPPEPELVPEPAQEAGALPSTATGPPPPPRPTMPTTARPRGLYAGLATGGAVTLVSAIGIGVSGYVGEQARRDITEPVALDPQYKGIPLCDLNPQPAGCPTWERAGQVQVAAVVGLALGAVTIAVFGGLLGRHLHRRKTRAISLDGVRLGSLAVRF